MNIWTDIYTYVPSSKRPSLPPSSRVSCIQYSHFRNHKRLWRSVHTPWDLDHQGGHWDTSWSSSGLLLGQVFLLVSKPPCDIGWKAMTSCINCMFWLQWSMRRTNTIRKLTIGLLTPHTKPFHLQNLYVLILWYSCILKTCLAKVFTPGCMSFLCDIKTILWYFIRTIQVILKWRGIFLYFYQLQLHDYLIIWLHTYNCNVRLSFDIRGRCP